MKGQQIVIVGNGIAGNSAAVAIRSLNRDVGLTIISDETVPLYSPCAFYKYLSGEMAKQKLFLKKLEDYAKEGINVVFGKEASEVNVGAGEVRVGDQKIHFDKLILATGSKAFFPPIKGVDKKGVFPLKTMADAEKVSAYPAKKVVVVGSGPIGLEAAMSLSKRGAEVSIIEVFNRVLPRLFDDQPASVLREIIERNGVKVLTEEKVTEISGDQSVKVLITDKREMACDMVIMAAGVAPNTVLAKSIGVEIGGLRGIKTDDHMMTGIEGVYACGDCVESRDIITGNNTLSLLWHNAKRQGGIAGLNSLGAKRRFIGSLDATTIEIFGTYAVSIGKCAAAFKGQTGYEVVEKTYDSTYTRLIVSGDRLAGAQFINKPRHAGMLTTTMWKRDNLTELRKIFLDEKLLAMQPWRYWLGRYVKDCKTG